MAVQSVNPVQSLQNPTTEKKRNREQHTFLTLGPINIREPPHFASLKHLRRSKRRLLRSQHPIQLDLFPIASVSAPKKASLFLIVTIVVHPHPHSPFTTQAR
jgi:hypothetical protein